jgi:hypothetical protein
MITATIWTQLVKTLQGNPTLSKYVKYVYEGRRSEIEPESLPCIMLEPTGNGEPERRMNNVDYQYFNLDLFAFSSNNFSEFPKVIVGDQKYKGILDVEQDLRAVLKGSNTLGDKVTDILIDPTSFDVVDVDKYPVRGFVMPIRILYKQTDSI